MELYRKVRLACRDGMSERAAARHFGVSRQSVRKMLQFSVPPGYRRTAPVRRPKLDEFTALIEQWLEDDRRHGYRAGAWRIHRPSTFGTAHRTPGTRLPSLHVIGVPAVSRATSATTADDASTTSPVIATMNVRASVSRGASGTSARKPKRARQDGGERGGNRSHPSEFHPGYIPCIDEYSDLFTHPMACARCGFGRLRGCSLDTIQTDFRRLQLDTTSINPPLTGVPSASLMAAPAVTRPAISDGPISRRSFSRASARP